MVNFANECVTNQGVLLAYGSFNTTDPLAQQFPQELKGEAVRDLALLAAFRLTGKDITQT